MVGRKKPDPACAVLRDGIHHIVKLWSFGRSLPQQGHMVRKALGGGNPEASWTFRNDSLRTTSQSACFFSDQLPSRGEFDYAIPILYPDTPGIPRPGTKGP